MARAAAGLPAGIRLSDHVRLGVIARTFPLDQVQQVLAETGKASERDLPAHVIVYYATALALDAGSSTREVLRCLLEGLRWLWGAEAVRVAGKSGISQARTRLGAEPLRRLHDRVVRPMATRATRGAWHRRWRLASLDGSCLDVADTEANRTAFGRPGAGRGESAFPQVRFVALVERTAPMPCSVPGWAASRRARPCSPGKLSGRCGRACCAWPTGSSSAMRSGRKPSPAAPTCSGG